MGLNNLTKLSNQQTEHQYSQTKYDLFEWLTGQHFEQQIQSLQDKVNNYKDMEAKAEEKRKRIWEQYKQKVITWTEYTDQVKALLPWDPSNNPIFWLEKDIRELRVQQDIVNIPQDNILSSTSQLGENISDGWSNSLGVFIIDEDKVARKSAHGYDDASRLILYKDRIQSPVIKKTLQVMKLDGYVYQVQQRAYGQSLTKLTTQEKNIIPQQHLEQFWNAIDEMRQLWLSLDISWGKSNVFYDQKYGFSIIDLGIWWFSDNSTIQQTLFDK